MVSDAAKAAELKSASLIFESTTIISVKFRKNVTVLKIDGTEAAVEQYDSTTWVAQIENLPAIEKFKVNSIKLAGIIHSDIYFRLLYERIKGKYREPE